MKDSSINPQKYATRWLDFVGELYSAIVAGKYKKIIYTKKVCYKVL